MTKNRYYSSIKKRIEKGEFYQNSKKISEYVIIFKGKISNLKKNLKKN